MVLQKHRYLESLNLSLGHTCCLDFWCKLFNTAIHSMGYFRHVTRLYADKWKLMFLCPN